MQRMTPKMIERIPNGFMEIAEQYSAMPMELLFVRAVLGTPVAPAIDGRLHLDSILARALINTCSIPPAWGDEPAVIPLPVELLWESSDGLPLWSCSDLFVIGKTNSAVEYWHKRFPEQRIQDLCAKPNTDTGSGRYKEYRIPVRTEMPADQILHAICMGNRKEIERLLGYISHIGKKPSQGKGRVLRWYVEPICDDNIKDIILFRRSVPLAYLVEQEKITETVSQLSPWTPPYWYRPWHAPVRLPHEAN